MGPDKLDIKLDRLLKIGGFPEPYLENDETFYNRWKRSHLDIILKQDLIDLENIHQITSIETLIQLLRKRSVTPSPIDPWPRICSARTKPSSGG